MAFRHWVAVGELNESQKITDYLKLNDGRELRDVVAQVPAVKDFMEKVVLRNLVPLRQGKTGLWVFGKLTFPVRVSQETQGSVTLARTDNKSWDELANRAPVFADPNTKAEIIVPKNRVNITSEREYLKYLNWFTYVAMKDGARDLGEFFTTLIHRYRQPLEASIERRDSAMTTTDFDVEKLPAIEDKFAIKNSRSNKPGGDGEAFITFPNAWKWLNLHRGYCDREGDAAGHCGNSGHQEGETILSLRDQDNRIHMTVVIDKRGITNEMKAPGNRKPKAYTHPYVIELLKNPLIRGVGPGKYMPENDFQLHDLGDREWDLLAQARPDLAETSTISTLAMQSRGDQRKFQGSVEQEFGVKFPYTFDTRSRAVLVEYGNFDGMVEKWKIEDEYGNPLEIPDVGSWNDLESVNGKAFACLEMIRDYWDILSPQVRSAITQHFKTDRLDEIGEHLDALARKSSTLRNHLAAIYKDVMTTGMVQNTNRVNHADRDSNPDDWFVNFENKNGLLVKVLIHPRAAEESLRKYKRLVPPQSIVSSAFRRSENADAAVTLSHELERSRFWERPSHVDISKENPNIARISPDTIAQRKAAYDLQIRNEMIHREIAQRMMDGTYDQYVAELKKRGWWDDYAKWSGSD